MTNLETEIGRGIIAEFIAANYGDDVTVESAGELVGIIEAFVEYLSSDEMADDWDLFERTWH
jgi:hypothetical protein